MIDKYWLIKMPQFDILIIKKLTLWKSLAKMVKIRWKNFRSYLKTRWRPWAGLIEVVRTGFSWISLYSECIRREISYLHLVAVEHFRWLAELGHSNTWFRLHFGSNIYLTDTEIRLGKGLFCRSRGCNIAQKNCLAPARSFLCCFNCMNW